MRENKEACGERTLRLVEEQPIVKISGLSKDSWALTEAARLLLLRYCPDSAQIMRGKFL